MGVQYAMTANAHEFVTKAAKEWFFQPMTSRLAQAGLRTDALAEPTGNSAEAGFAMDTVQPTTLANIAALKNAIGLTVQSRAATWGCCTPNAVCMAWCKPCSPLLDSASTRARDLARSRHLRQPRHCQPSLPRQPAGAGPRRTRKARIAPDRPD